MAKVKRYKKLKEKHVKALTAGDVAGLQEVQAELAELSNGPVARRGPQHEEQCMDRERIKGGLRKASGAMKEKAGQVVGKRHLEAEGKLEKTEGDTRSAVGKAKDAVRDLFKK